MAGSKPGLKKQCRICGEQIGWHSLPQHERACTGKGLKKIVTHCSICATSFEGLTQHQKTGHSRKCNGSAGKGMAGWNRGLTQESDERVREAVKARIPSLIGKSHPCSDANKLNMSRIAKERDWGGYLGGGRGIRGRYMGYWCDSSWELAWVIYSLDHGVEFERNWKKFKYLDADGIQHSYLPDFATAEGYVEVKGYVQNEEILKAKLASTDRPTVLLRKEAMLPILSWVSKKYGKDFVRLYAG